MATASPLIKAFRNFLAGHVVKVQSRYTRELAKRTQPPPNLPGGPAHKLAANYYCDRDLRRAVDPPTVVYGQLKQLQAPEGEGEQLETQKPCTPGGVYDIV